MSQMQAMSLPILWSLEIEEEYLTLLRALCDDVEFVFLFDGDGVSFGECFAVDRDFAADDMQPGVTRGA